MAQERMLSGMEYIDIRTRSNWFSRSVNWVFELLIAIFAIPSLLGLVINLPIVLLANLIAFLIGLGQEQERKGKSEDLPEWTVYIVGLIPYCFLMVFGFLAGLIQNIHFRVQEILEIDRENRLKLRNRPVGSVVHSERI